MFGICKGFFPPTETVFYLNKREHVLFSSESVFEKFYVMFPWLSGKCFGAKIICTIEQAGKKSQREQTHLPTHPACKERGNSHSANPLSTFSQEVQAPCPGLGRWWRWEHTLANCRALLCVLFYVFSVRVKLVGLGTVSCLLSVFCSAWRNTSPPAPGWLMSVSMAPGGAVLC